MTTKSGNSFMRMCRSGFILLLFVVCAIGTASSQTIAWNNSLTNISAALNIIVSYLALFLAVCIFFKKNKHISDYYLIAWMFVFSAFAFCKLETVPFFSIAGRFLSALHGILLFLYIKNITLNSHFNPKDLLHFISFIIMLLPFFFIDDYVFTRLFWAFKFLFYVIYIILSILMVGRYRRRIKDNYSNVKYADISWLNAFIYGILFFAVSPAITIMYPEYPVLLIETVGLFTFMTIMGVNGVIHSADFFVQPVTTDATSERKFAYANYGLKNSDADILSDRLSMYMECEKPYLNPTLSLKDLATAMDTYSHYITQILNTVFNHNFHDFVNQYRVEEAERQLADPSNAKLTILAIAYDCGFNSKATFNRVFKEKKGVTPTEYKLTVQKLHTSSI